MKTMRVPLIAVLMPVPVLAFIAAGTWLTPTPKPIPHLERPARPVLVPTTVDEPPGRVVAKALRFLAKAQLADGHWEEDGGAFPVAATALAGLAMFMSEKESVTTTPDGMRSTTRTIDHDRSVSRDKAVDWLVERSKARRDGLMISEHLSESSRYMQGHGHATIFLAGCLDQRLEPEARIAMQNAVSQAVTYIAAAQSSEGGWHETSKIEGHDFAEILPTVVQIQALRAAGTVGGRGGHDDGQEFVRSWLNEQSPDPDPQANADPTRLAAALAVERVRGAQTVLASARSTVRIEHYRKLLDRCRFEIQVAMESTLDGFELAHLNYALAETEIEIRKEYLSTMLDRLRKTQLPDGGWPAGKKLGRVQTTAIWCILLQLDNRRHPASEPPVEPTAPFIFLPEVQKS